MVKVKKSKVNTDIAVRNRNYHTATGNHMPSCNHLPPCTADPCIIVDKLQFTFKHRSHVTTLAKPNR